MKILHESPRALVLHASLADVAEYAAGEQIADVTITDPPYTAHVHDNIRSCSTNGKVKVKQRGPGFDALTNFEHVGLLLALTRRWTLAFCALESFGDYEESAGGQWKAGGSYVRSGVWRKPQAAPQLSGDRPANSCEGVAVMHPRMAPVFVACDACEGTAAVCDECHGSGTVLRTPRLHWNGRGKHAYWRTEGTYQAFQPFEDDEIMLPVFMPADDLFLEYGRERSEKVHPCQKPIVMIRELVRLFSDPGEWVLDPYCGSGAHGIAALLEGRNVILADADLKWAEHTARAVAEFERRAA